MRAPVPYYYNYYNKVYGVNDVNEVCLLTNFMFINRFFIIDIFYNTISHKDCYYTLCTSIVAQYDNMQITSRVQCVV